MSAGYATLQTFALRRAEQADPYFDEGLAEAARALLAGGPVEFKLSTRVAESALPPAKRRLYAALRCLPGWLYVPPALAMQRAIFSDWFRAVAECQTANDQLLAMPLNRTYGADCWDVAVECRPRDESDRRRYLTLASVFGARPQSVECADRRRDFLRMCLESLPAIDSRLRALEARVHALEGEGADADSVT